MQRPGAEHPVGTQLGRFAGDADHVDPVPDFLLDRAKPDHLVQLIQKSVGRILRRALPGARRPLRPRRPLMRLVGIALFRLLLRLLVRDQRHAALSAEGGFVGVGPPANVAFFHRFIPRLRCLACLWCLAPLNFYKLYKL